MTADRDGIRVVMILSTDRLRTGDVLRASVSIANIGADAAFWDNACGLVGGFTVDGPTLEAQDNGKDWDGLAGLIKALAINRNRSHIGFVPPNTPSDARFGCRGGSEVVALPPGGVEHVEAIWRGRTSDLVPAPPGSYGVGYHFAFRGRARDGDPDPSAAPVVVRTAIEVLGPGFVGISAGVAVDAALSDPLVSAWIQTSVGASRLSGASIILDDAGRWRLRIDLQEPAGRRITSTATILIDPMTSTIVSRDLPAPAPSPPVPSR